MSSEPDTTVWPSPLTATQSTLSVCPLKVFLHSPDIMSQTLHTQNHKQQKTEQHSHACSHSLDVLVIRPRNDAGSIFGDSHPVDMPGMPLQHRPEGRPVLLFRQQPGRWLWQHTCRVPCDQAVRGRIDRQLKRGPAKFWRRQCKRRTLRTHACVVVDVCSTGVLTMHAWW